MAGDPRAPSAAGRPGATVIWDPRFSAYDFGPEHPFSERPRALAVDLLERSLAPEERAAVDWVREVPPAPPETLARFHRPGYIELVRRVGDGEETVLLDQGDTPGTPGCYTAAARIVAGAVRGAEEAWERKRPAFHPSGGLHHAHPGRASGFCIFNDVAVAIATSLAAGRRVAYLDIDAHHGDGVMYGFYGSGRLLDIDFHQDGRTLFPGTGFSSETGEGDGAGLKVNIPLPPGAGDEALLPLFRRIVPSLLDRFRPDAIVLQHGVDGHAGDALAQLQYTPAAYAEVDRTIVRYAREHAGGRLLVTGGGGYRARSVSRVLARAGRIVAGLDLPADPTPVPDDWDTGFFEETGEPAPTTWSEPADLVPSPWRAEDEERVIADLAERLGERFPGPRTAAPGASDRRGSRAA